MLPAWSRVPGVSILVSPSGSLDKSRYPARLTLGTHAYRTLFPAWVPLRNEASALRPRIHFV